jgi:hypothetical protein
MVDGTTGSDVDDTAVPASPPQPPSPEDPPAAPAQPEAPVTAPPIPAGGIPRISDYWPDAPHRMGPTADFYRYSTKATPRPAGLVPLPPRPGTASGRRTGHPGRRALLGSLLVAAALAAAAIVVATVAHRMDARPAAIPLPGPASGPATSAPPAIPVPVVANDHTISAPQNGLRTATFELASDVVSVSVRSAALGGDLFRISTPATSGMLPRATVKAGTVRLVLARVRAERKPAVTVTLSAGVRWSVRITGGVAAGALDLRGIPLAAVALAGNATRIDLHAPRPRGTLPVRITGGINQFRLTTADAVPARVRARGGAGRVVLYGRTDNGVARGRSFVAGAFDAGRDRIDLDVVAGIGSAIVTTGR